MDGGNIDFKLPLVAAAHSRMERTTRGKIKPKPLRDQLALGRARKRVSDLTGEELKAQLERHNVTQQQFARIVGSNSETVIRWCSGEMDGKIPRWVDLVFELFDVKPSVTTRFIGARGPRPGSSEDDA